MKPFTIGKLSQQTDCNIETIRYYERIRLLPAPPRSSGGHRLYGDQHLKRLIFIRRSRQLGFTIHEVRSLLQLVDSGDYTCSEIKALTLEHVVGIRRKIADLGRLEQVLEVMISQCENDQIPDCPIIDALFDSTTHGEG